ncbi:hypothetical protein [Streptomyces sp. NPDC051993]|uniref:hypothetical protein n=1 Tax=Streptomyces sp. NPDC051993 TaxID=3155286 RepID=UPI0034400533
MPKHPPSSRAEHGTPSAVPRLTGAEAAVIIAVIGVAAVLVAGAGLPVYAVLQLLGGAGLIAGAVIALTTRPCGQAVKRALKALLTST